jgi:hypothetical protein
MRPGIPQRRRSRKVDSHRRWVERAARFVVRCTTVEPPATDLDRFAARCAALGFDLVQPFAVGWYNDAVDIEYRLAAAPDRLGLLIGNTRALWEPFLAAWRAEAVLRADPNPVDCYTASRIGALVAELRLDGELRFAHEPPPRRLAVQRLADVSGLAPLSPVGLNIHPRFGPWIGLRAALVLDRRGPSGPPPAVANPCPDYAATCVAAFERACAADGALPDTWRLWLAVRDACPIGRAYRYSEAQIRYHYTKDRGALG